MQQQQQKSQHEQEIDNCKTAFQKHSSQLHEINQDKIEINTSILKKGMYNMKVYNNKTNFTSKIAVK